MHYMSFLRAAGAGALVALAVVAPAADAKSVRQDVKLSFAAVAGDTPVGCGVPIPGLGSTNATATLADLRFYISEVRLLRRDGFSVPLRLAADSRYQVTRGRDRVTLIDLENATGSCSGDAATNAVIRGTVPKATYVGVRMTLGVPFALNHTDVPAAPAPLNLQAMAWSWQSGRKFAKIEYTDPGGGTPWASKLFAVHLGSTGCQGNPATGATVRCGVPNRAAIRFRSFDPAKQKIAVDVKAIAAGSDITVNRAGAAGCMSGPTDPECVGVMRAFAVNWKADGTGSGRSPDGGAQSAFRVISK